MKCRGRNGLAMMIQVENLRFSYTGKPFIDNMNFSVGEGEIFGFLGPSGAGKSTLQRILTGLITTYEGSAKLFGMETKKHDSFFYERIGVDFEFPSLYEKLTARENLAYFSSLYAGKKRDVDSLFARVGLSGQEDKRVSDYSKGMKSRLNFIKSLVHQPEILFLDEPTSGLDPSNSRIMKEMILEEKAKGRTIILTTHNMMDAAELCDRVAFIVDGTIKALDTPHNLIMEEGASKLVYTYEENGGEQVRQCPLESTATDALLHRLLTQNKITSIHSSEPTLEDIFLKLTGRALV